MNKMHLIILSFVAFVALVYFGFILNEQYIHPTQCQVIITQSENKSNINSSEHKFFQKIPQAPPMPAIGIVGLILISLIPLVMLYSNIKVEKKLSESIEILSRFNDRRFNKKRISKPTLGRELLSRLLEPNEIMVVERLLKETKGIHQKEIVKMPGMNKLKAHRLVERLRKKGIVEVQKEGKTNLIKLNQHIKNLIMDLE